MPYRKGTKFQRPNVPSRRFSKSQLETRSVLRPKTKLTMITRKVMCTYSYVTQFVTYKY